MLVKRISYVYSVIKENARGDCRIGFMNPMLADVSCQTCKKREAKLADAKINAYMR